MSECSFSSYRSLGRQVFPVNGVTGLERERSRSTQIELINQDLRSLMSNGTRVYVTDAVLIDDHPVLHRTYTVPLTEIMDIYLIMKQ